ncbi:MAG: DUF1934 family protein [Clostridiales bacterium]|nr:DUF1934 family protein [Clostridiales bacterium]
MKYITDIYYSSQNEPYEKASGYIVDEGSIFRIGFTTLEYGFEVKNDNGKISVIRTGEQAYTINLSKTPSTFNLTTPYGILSYKTQLISFSNEKKNSSCSITLVYSLTDNTNHTQKNTLKLRGMIK